MSWVRRGVVGLLVLAVLVPALVVAGAIAGWSPRHWSGTELVAVRLPGLIDSTPPSDAEGRMYTEGELSSLRDGLTPVDLPEGAAMVSTDSGRRQVIIATAGLSHGGFALCADRYGDAVAISWLPLGGGMSTMDISGAAPSTRHGPGAFTTWLTLATGFPWYLAAGVILTAGGWLLFRWRRQRWSPSSRLRQERVPLRATRSRRRTASG